MFVGRLRPLVARWVAVVSVVVSFGASASADFGAERASVDARYAADWVVDGGDNQGKPFVVVDKRDARVYVFDARGVLIGATPALLGLAIGDGSIADIASRAPASLSPSERTTPAGRFESRPGHNSHGEDIVWIDYQASLAIHRLRPAPPSERRPERLAATAADAKRISYGCVVVPVAFYEGVVAPLLGRRAGVVYVLPERRPVREMLGAIDVSLRTR